MVRGRRSRQRLLVQKQILEDRLFRRILPQEYHHLRRRLQSIGTPERELLDNMVARIEGALRPELVVRIESRIKHLFSIYRKLSRSGKSLSDLYDLQGIRLICAAETACYLVAKTIQSLYEAIPGRYKDYIREPKPNGYRSLHMTVRGPTGSPVEIQIRTCAMHILAEGVHEDYKRKELANGFNAI